ncbi:MAG: hypothetical protein U7123_12870 [Potamolinea sp.]
MTLVSSTQTVTIYKAPQPGKAEKLLKNGFQPADFPNNPPYADGKCYFAAPNSRSLAEEYIAVSSVMRYINLSPNLSP